MASTIEFSDIGMFSVQIVEKCESFREICVIFGPKRYGYAFVFGNDLEVTIVPLTTEGCNSRQGTPIIFSHKFLCIIICHVICRVEDET
mgnify:CR=1 FL=1